jgi:hypothetical protein
LENLTGPSTVAGPLRLQRGGYTLTACPADDPDRAELEAFVQARYREIHGAEVRSFMPVLLALRDGAGRLCGVAGYRAAAVQPLYLEQYLAGPVEHAVSQRTGEAVGRAAIAEIGNFACTGCRRGRVLVQLLCEFADLRGHSHVVFTGTLTVRQIMAHLGIELLELVAASRASLHSSVEDWGRYYETDPKVVVGRVAQALPVTATARRRAA